MEEKILDVIRSIDEQGGMYQAVSTGFVQRMIGKSALEYQEKIDRGERVIVGVNGFQREGGDDRPPTLERPSADKIDRYLHDFRTFKAQRSQSDVDRALDDLARAFDDDSANTFGAVVHAIGVGATHGEVCARTRAAVGFGEPLVVP
jgi:methylmalonyl-CoA mutase N-terminal domain/subunit